MLITIVKMSITMFRYYTVERFLPETERLIMTGTARYYQYDNNAVRRGLALLGYVLKSCIIHKRELYT